MSLPRVVIVGAGFGGLACAKALGSGPVQVTLVDRHNYHLFVPLLYQVATAALSPPDVAEPVRRIVRKHRNVEVAMGEVAGIDWRHRAAILDDGRRLDYDALVIATGSEYSYFGNDEAWSAHAPGLKTLEDARLVRSRLLNGFEAAETCDDPETRRRLMTTVIIGGGPTGVEMAGSVAELARFTLSRDFRHIDPRQARVVLIEAGPRLLPAFPDSLSDYARRVLDSRGVDVLTDTAVDSVDAEGVVAGGRTIAAGTMVWAAGVKATPAARWLDLEPAKGGAIAVNPDLSVPERPGVYALGDVALAFDENGEALPGLAQVARQQGRHLGTELRRALDGGAPPAPFCFKSRGITAIVGRSAAVFAFGRHRLKGWTAWVLWALVHIYLLVGFDKRVLVATQWLWRWLTYERGARIIVGPMQERPPPKQE